MTDRLKGCIVVFDRDIREDDAQPLIDAIKQMRGVAEVSPSVVGGDDYINRARIRAELEGKLYEALRPKEK